MRGSFYPDTTKDIAELCPGTPISTPGKTFSSFVQILLPLRLGRHPHYVDGIRANAPHDEEAGGDGVLGGPLFRSFLSLVRTISILIIGTLDESRVGQWRGNGRSRVGRKRAGQSGEEPVITYVHNYHDLLRSNSMMIIIQKQKEVGNRGFFFLIQWPPRKSSASDHSCSRATPARYLPLTYQLFCTIPPNPHRTSPTSPHRTTPPTTPTTKTTMPPTRRTTNPRLLLPLPPPSTPSTSTSTPTATVTPTPTLPSPSSTRTPSHTHTHASPSPPRPAPTTDPLWHTMQSTLSTLPGHSGGSGSNVFFTAAHTRALDELRIAQMALAQAWMSDATSSPSGGEVGAGGAGGVGGAGGQGAGGAAAWEKKRLASDAHFGRVASGVRDVAAKLDRVVDAMGDVEVESRGIWGG